MDINALNTLDQLQIAIAFILYAFVFGWIGYRRGQTREAWVFAVATVSLIVLRLQGDVFVGIANLGWQLVNMLAGGLSSGGSTPDLIIPCPSPQTVPATDCNAPGYLFLLWVTIVILTYVITTSGVKKSVSNGWAILLGLGNGLLYASVFLPRLIGLVRPDQVQLDEPVILETLIGLIQTAFSVIWNVITEFWTAVEPVRPFVILLLLILIVVGAASTLRSAKA
jgi:hypothetical protein